jgi:hypothetical protein
MRTNHENIVFHGRTRSDLSALGLTVALFQGSPAQGQTETGSTFQVVPTPNENSNSELFAASASSSNDIWAVGQSTIHFDGTTWTAFPAPTIKGDNNSLLQGVVDISPTVAWAPGNVSDGAHQQQVIEQWNGTKWSLFPGPKFGKKDRADIFAMTSSSGNDVWAIGGLVSLGPGAGVAPFRALERRSMDGDNSGIEP